MTLRKTLRTIGNAAGVFACAAIIVVAAAQIVKAEEERCGDYGSFFSVLSERYGEEIVGRGLSGNLVFELWVNPEKGTWTVLYVGPDGIACMPDAGEYWEAFEPVKGDPA